MTTDGTTLTHLIIPKTVWSWAGTYRLRRGQMDILSYHSVCLQLNPALINERPPAPACVCFLRGLGVIWWLL